MPKKEPSDIMKEFRIVVVGSGGVGKSALTIRFMKGHFVERYDPTIEDSYKQMMEVDGVSVLLDIMDTAGQDEYKSLRDHYMKNGEGFIIVFSLTVRASFETTRTIHAAVLRSKPQDIPVVLVGNKLDLQDHRQISTEEGKELADSWGSTYVEASAKTNQGVSEVFSSCVRAIIAWRRAHPPPPEKKTHTCILL